MRAHARTRVHVCAHLHLEGPVSRPAHARGRVGARPVERQVGEEQHVAREERRQLRRRGGNRAREKCARKKCAGKVRGKSTWQKCAGKGRAEMRGKSALEKRAESCLGTTCKGPSRFVTNDDERCGDGGVNV
eukprot:3457329-Pleurochrysis_carterae.AAC.1